MSRWYVEHADGWNVVVLAKTAHSAQLAARALRINERRGRGTVVACRPAEGE